MVLHVSDTIFWTEDTLQTMSAIRLRFCPVFPHARPKSVNISWCIHELRIKLKMNQLSEFPLPSWNMGCSTAARISGWVSYVYFVCAFFMLPCVSMNRVLRIVQSKNKGVEVRDDARQGQLPNAPKSELRQRLETGSSFMNRRHESIVLGRVCFYLVAQFAPFP